MPIWEKSSIVIRSTNSKPSWKTDEINGEAEAGNISFSDVDVDSGQAAGKDGF